MINLKIRLKNPVFLWQIVLSLSMPIFAYMGISVKDITSWEILGNIILDALHNPYVLGLVLISVFNAVTDPTTKGLKDSERALTYKDLQ